MRIYKVRRKPAISIMTFCQEVSGRDGERIQVMLIESSNQKATLTSNHHGVCSLLLQTEEAWSWTVRLPGTTKHLAE